MRVRPRSSLSWPFGLLLAAWICVTLPPTTTLHACLWLKGAKHFSHHAGLSRDVAGLLSGRPAQPVTTVQAAAEQNDPAPAIPLRMETKPAELALSPAPLRLIGLLPRPSRPEWKLRPPAAPVIEVPCPPPRAAASA